MIGFVQTSSFSLSVIYSSEWLVNLVNFNRKPFVLTNFIEMNKEKITKIVTQKNQLHLVLKSFQSLIQILIQFSAVLFKLKWIDT